MRAEDFFNTVRSAIRPDYLCTPHAGKLLHEEQHRDGTSSTFCVIPSGRMVALSLDKKGKDPFPILAPGLNSRNDLTIICLGQSGKPLVFVIECKNSANPGDAQHQMECGKAFCEYLFKLILFQHGTKVSPDYFGVAVYLPKSPPKGLTRPKFIQVGLHSLMRAEWHLAVDLPLSELIRAAEGAS
ncbi:MAG: hypothetical protein Q8Q28_01415 [Pseudomonadota bacterium]|nr:hypothetical protein [Pseudomonadota bacterium]